MIWRIKGILQKALSVTPGGSRLNDLLQLTLGGLRNIDATVDSKVVDDWMVLARQLRELDVQIQDATLVEVGTGWFPVLPLCFSLAGARTCHTFDISRHLNTALTSRAIVRLKIHLAGIADASGARMEDVERRYARLAAAADSNAALERAGVRYHAPADAAQTSLPNRSVDAVFSNSVFEHIPPSGIAAILHETARIVKSNGVSLHSVNCGDHYAYFDRSTTPINYLKYSDREWRFWNNPLLFQNRLRPVDFLKLAEQAGLEVVSSKYAAKQKLLELLPTLEVAAEFRNYTPDQLCATSVDFAGRPR